MLVSQRLHQLYRLIYPVDEVTRSAQLGRGGEGLEGGEGRGVRGEGLGGERGG